MFLGGNMVAEGGMRGVHWKEGREQVPSGVEDKERGQTRGRVLQEGL